MLTFQTIVTTLDIAYISVLQFALAIFMNIGLDKTFNPEREKLDEHASIWGEFLLLCLMISVLVTLSYIIRRIVRIIPSPLHAVQGLRHDKLPELTDIAPITGFVLLTSGYVDSRIRRIRQYFGLDTNFLDIDKQTKYGSSANK